MLQNWFCQSNMVMIAEDYYAQLFYDNNVNAFYLVEDDEHNHIVVIQITDENEGFLYCVGLMKEYEYKNNDVVIGFSPERSKA